MCWSEQKCVLGHVESAGGGQVLKAMKEQAWRRAGSEELLKERRKDFEMGDIFTNYTEQRNRGE